MIVRADRDAARDDHHVGALERRGRGRPRWRRGRRAAAPVGGQIAPWWVASATSMGPFELWISPGPSGSPGALQLVAGAQHLDPGAAGHAHRTGAGRHRGAQLGRAEQACPLGARWCRRACPRLGRGYCRPVASPSRVRICAVADLDVLLGDDRGGAGRDGATGRDPDRLALAERPGRGRAGARLTDHFQRPVRGAGARSRSRPWPSTGRAVRRRRPRDPRRGPDRAASMTATVSAPSGVAASSDQLGGPARS